MPSIDEIHKEASLNLQKLYVLLAGLESKEERVQAAQALAALTVNMAELAAAPREEPAKPAAQQEMPEGLKVLTDNAEKIMEVLSSFIRMK